VVPDPISQGDGEAALGNREFFLNKPYGIGGGMKDNIP
jgi:hypothetical protein